MLLEPEIPPNTGNIIRLCANTGARLHLVRPLGFTLDRRSLRRAGLDYDELANVEVHDDLAACHLALARARWFGIETGGTRAYSQVRYREGDALLFGNERTGLPEPVLSRLLPGHHLSIPMRPDNRSLNLSNAAAIVAYEAWRQLKFAGSAAVDHRPASRSRHAPDAEGAAEDLLRDAIVGD